MGRAGRWALLLGALGCSELKTGSWAPDATAMADGGVVVDAGVMVDAGVRDAGPPCPRDRLRCGDRCIDPRDDRMNCGACGVQCADCRDGRCR